MRYGRSTREPACSSTISMRRRNGNMLPSAYSHDASGRLVQNYEGANPPCVAPYGLGMTSPECFVSGTRQKTYDAENRLRSETYPYPNGTTVTSYGSTSTGWSPTGSPPLYQPANIQAVDYDGASHPKRFNLYHPDYGPSTAAETRACLLRDGNDRLLTCQLINAQCTTPVFSLEGLGDYNVAAGTISVNDRNRAGIVVT